ncbi:MAG: hypothetical protein V3T77_03115 [Planctomycetota bacterium]
MTICISKGPDPLTFTLSRRLVRRARRIADQMPGVNLNTLVFNALEIHLTKLEKMYCFAENASFESETRLAQRTRQMALQIPGVTLNSLVVNALENFLTKLEQLHLNRSQPCDRLHSAQGGI